MNGSLSAETSAGQKLPNEGDTSMKEAIRTTLAALTELDGLPGFEQPVVDVLSREFAETEANIEVDTMENLFVEYQEGGEGPHLMITAHSDEIGAIVTHVDREGFLRIQGLGGVAPVLMIGRRVHVAGHLGVIGIRPVHLQSAEEKMTAPPIDRLYVDMGASSDTEVAEMGIQIGTPVAYESPLQSFTNGDRLCGKAIDNRIGCAILLQLFRELAGEPIGGRVTGVVTVQEEVGLRGATVAARRVNPDYAIVIDTVPVADTPDVAAGRMTGAIGKGPVLVVAAAGGGGRHVGHPRLIEWIEAAALEVDAVLQRAATMGYAVTDAAAISLANYGVPTVALGVARRYSHSPVCTFDLNDAVAAVRILEQLVSDIAGLEEQNFQSGRRRDTGRDSTAELETGRGGL